MDSPQNHIWGPALWMILHSSAERFGSLLLRRLPKEEIRIWGGLLLSLRYSLPCPACKKHYTEYLSKTPPPMQKEGLRAWLHHLHSQVNQRLAYPTIALEQVEEQYRVPFHFSKHCAVVEKEMVKALRLGHATREDIQRTARFFEELRRFYDFF